MMFCNTISYQNKTTLIRYGNEYVNLNSTTISLTGIEGYQNLVLWKNLFVKVNRIYASAETQQDCSYSYNAATGKLTVGKPTNVDCIYFSILYIPQ